MNDLNKIKTKAFEAFHEPIYRGTVAWDKFLTIKNQDAKAIELGAVLSGGIYAPAGTGDITPDEIDTANNLITSQAYERKERVRWQDLDDNPELVTEVANGMGAAAMASLLKFVTDFMAGLWTLPHPNTSLVGAGKKFIDTDLRINGDAGNLQSNKLNLALSADAFHAAMTILAKYKNHRDVTLDLGKNGVALVYGPENRKVALQLLQSTLSGADNQVNIIRDMNVVGVELPEFEEDWLVVDGVWRPVVLNMRRMPEVLISQTTDSVWIEIVGRFTAAIGVKPTEAGLAGSDAP